MPKVLVANRGEIAIRILRSAAELGWTTVAIYTDGDESHATFADEVVKLDRVSDYLDVGKIVNIAERSRCTHLHPGYGFLSESPALAQALPESIVFVGPSVETLHISSDKLMSRDLASSLGVKIAPGTRVLSSRDVYDFSRAEGFPVMIKALDGGGGRGIRIVHSNEEIEEAFNRCMGESPSRQLFVEEALTGPFWKHVEVQILGDGSGAVTHRWERECSVQRRFQKIIEVAPARLDTAVIRTLVDSSTKMAKQLNYRGLGTFEYLVNSKTLDWVFLEINPRVQVEHTVTEEVLGFDLVRTQLLLFTPTTTLASLSLSNSPPRPKGYAIQLRLTAEDPARSFQLSPGTLKTSTIVWPSGPGIRIDTWLSSGPSCRDTVSQWNVGTEFDSLLAKIIVRGSSFEEASQKAKRAMRELRIGGPVMTNRNLLAGVLDHPDWLAGTIGTLWLEQNIDTVLELGTTALQPTRPPGNLPKVLVHSQTDGKDPVSSGSTLLQPGTLFHLTLSPSASATSAPAKHSLTLSSISHNAFPDRLSGVLQTSLSSTPLMFSLSQSTSTAVTSSAFELANPNDSCHVASPLTGKIVKLHPALLAASHDAADEHARSVKKGEVIVILSVMKMESVIVTPRDALVERVGKGIQVGVVVGEGVLVCVLGNDSRSLASRL
ncbi:putative biotin carboxylase C-terminal domain [Lyophyllum shimeji]|uniref:Biotin carboxylase C-terminal domain n=1 Tax=Lyophyllum shimeji TaxID=47721 RepID=A0A9P3PP75_LYOSH|nr:putative biotin carboxylase C-terminal domain [Lyophyllum shimeji]